MGSVKFWVLAPRNTHWLFEFLKQPLGGFHLNVFEADTRNKTYQTMWKGIKTRSEMALLGSGYHFTNDLTASFFIGFIDTLKIFCDKIIELQHTNPTAEHQRTLSHNCDHFPLSRHHRGFNTPGSQVLQQLGGLQVSFYIAFKIYATKTIIKNLKLLWRIEHIHHFSAITFALLPKITTLCKLLIEW